MCGIVGFCGNDKDSLTCMMDSIIHRGPDSAGMFLSDYFSMGMRRLSIIGLKDGDQPVYNEDRTIVTVFNGEIYNYRDIKKRLTERGHVFNSATDTEVLVHAYEEYGDDLVLHLRGMFAFALYDIPKKRLLLARDFFGIKPLYYYWRDNLFMFGSEIKSFIKHPNFQKELNLSALTNYLTFQYSVLDETFFSGVYKLKPGHRLVFENGALSLSRYFEPDFSPEDMTIDAAADAIDKAVCESVRLHQSVTDVEAGAFLSGGIDSSYIAAHFSGRKTFTVGFPDIPAPRYNSRYNEIPYAKELADRLNITNYSMEITAEQFFDELPTIQYHMDEPLGDPSATALYFVSKLASGHVKIALSGEGADEFFGGYNIYKEPIDLRILTNLPKPIRKSLSSAANLFPFNIKGKNFYIRGGKTIEERFIGGAYIFNEKERKRIMRDPRGDIPPREIVRPFYERYKKHDDITKMQLLDINLWLVGDILLKADKMSMAHSLEARVPFLDREVFKVAAKLPVRLRVNKASTKHAFRTAAKRHLPEQTANRKKLGFPVPIRVWLREDKYAKIVRDYFTGTIAKSFFKTDELVKLLEAHQKGKIDNSRKIWTVLCFLIWYNRYFGDECNV